MNFEFSTEAVAAAEAARSALDKLQALKGARRAMNEGTGIDRPLWAEVARQGWLGACVPEEYGGFDAGYEVLCLLAQEVGRAGASLPMVSSAYLAIAAINRYGSDEQRARLLPPLVSGERIATLCMAEGGNPRGGALQARVTAGRLSGVKWPVLDGMVADLAVVVTGEPGNHALHVVELAGPQGTGCERLALQCLDPTRGLAQITFNQAPAEALEGGSGDRLAWLFNQAAVMIAFEQVGGAQACLDMAVAYAKGRYAFGRPIGSFQALKHKLADVYIAIELARSNAYFAAWAVSTDPDSLPVAAATAHASASEAFHLAAKENLQIHGGLGVTWEADCHLYLRRSQLLSTLLGSAMSWRARIVDELCLRPEAIAE